MYEDVSAVTKVGSNNADISLPMLTRREISGMEDKSRALFHRRANAEPSDSMKCLPHRSTLIPSSTSPVIRSRSDRLTYFPCLFREPHREESMGGRITKTTKILPKVRLPRSAHIGDLMSYFKTPRNSTSGFSTSSSHCFATQRRIGHWMSSFAHLR